MVSLLFLTCVNFYCDGIKVCKTTELIMAYPRDFMNKISGCNVVDGNLILARIEYGNVSYFNSLSFPELKEIRGYFLIYRVRGLKSIGALFPHLVAIRGKNLIGDYAFAMREVFDLQEVKKLTNKNTFSR